MFTDEFRGMTFLEVTLDQLNQARSELISTIKESLSIEEKNFLLSLKDLNPDWNLLGLEGVKDLPAVKWKLLNLRKMDESKRKIQRQLLEKKLFH